MKDDIREKRGERARTRALRMKTFDRLCKSSIRICRAGRSEPVVAGRGYTLLDMCG